MLCFDIVTRLGVVILLAYILMSNKTFNRYKQAFRVFQKLLEAYNINEPDIIIYDRDRTAINALEAVFLVVESILCTQYIDTTVEAQAYKIFRQQKSKDSIRYIASDLATECLSLYRIYRFTKTEQLFNDAYTAMLIRATRDDASDNDTNDTENADNAETAQDDDDKVDAITQLVTVDKRTNCNYQDILIQKDISIRQLKMLRYLERHQQVYKEKCIKAQTNKIRYFGYDVSLASKGVYVGLKKQTASARNDTLTLILKIALFYDSYVDRYTYILAIAQNTSFTRFVNRLFYYTINTIIDVRGLKAIAIQKQKYNDEKEKIAADPRHPRSVYTSVSIKTIDIVYSYELDGVTYLILSHFGDFYRILNIEAATEVRRLLEPLPRVSKRSAC